MEFPLISVIVPCYNAEKYIADSLKSLLDQTYFNLEIIVVNDGSTDHSEDIIKSFTDTRIKYFNQQNRGQCAALNYGFKNSTGVYIKFYDADDILTPDVIEGQVEVLKNENDSIISFIEWRRFYNNNLPISINLNDPHTIHRDCSPIEYITWKNTTPMVQCGLWLIPRKLLLRTGLWDERLSLINDTEFFSRIFCYVDTMKFSDKGYTYYRSNSKESSLSKDTSVKGIKSALLSIDLSAKWLLQIENSERIKRVIISSYEMILHWAFPKHKVFTKIIERRLQQYPKAYQAYTGSNKTVNLINKLLGWKAAKLSSIYYHKVRSLMTKI